MATVSYAVLEPATGHMRISAAGHFPPVAAAPGRRAALADIAVGVADDPLWQTTTLYLAPGTVLCFFTDGLVERWHTPIDDRLARLCQTVLPEPPERVCVSVMRPWSAARPPGTTSPSSPCAGSPAGSDPIRLGRRDRRGS